MIDLVCPDCGEELCVPEEAAGESARCPACGTVTDVPPAPAESAAEAPRPQPKRAFRPGGGRARKKRGWLRRHPRWVALACVLALLGGGGLALYLRFRGYFPRRGKFERILADHGYSRPDQTTQRRTPPDRDPQRTDYAAGGLESGNIIITWSLPGDDEHVVAVKALMYPLPWTKGPPSNWTPREVRQAGHTSAVRRIFKKLSGIDVPYPPEKLAPGEPWDRCLRNGYYEARVFHFAPASDNGKPLIEQTRPVVCSHVILTDRRWRERPRPSSRPAEADPGKTPATRRAARGARRPSAGARSP